jgi:hypothetical protein
MAGGRGEAAMARAKEPQKREAQKGTCLSFLRLPSPSQPAALRLAASLAAASKVDRHRTNR